MPTIHLEGLNENTKRILEARGIKVVEKKEESSKHRVLIIVDEIAERISNIEVYDEVEINIAEIRDLLDELRKITKK